VTTAAAPRTRVELLRGPVLVAAAGLSSAAILYLRDPHDEGAYGLCPFLALTGHPCPGCGGLRAVNDLTHGDIVGAVSSNVLAVALVGVVGMLWLIWTIGRWQGSDRPMMRVSDRTGIVALAVVLIFGVVRITPWGSWLAP
jgi:hypothetical protein